MNSAFSRQMDGLEDGHCVFRTDGQTRRWTLHFFGQIDGLMVSVLILCLVDHGFQSQLGQTKDYKLGICCFSAKYTALKRKNKDLVAWNQDDMPLVERHVY